MSIFPARRWLAALAAAAIATVPGCGGGTSDEPAAAAARQTRAAECSYDHVLVTVERIRLVRSTDQGRTSVEIAANAPAQVDLIAGADLLSSLRAAPLGPGQYSDLRLILAGDTRANTIQPTGAAAATLDTPAAAHAGLVLAGEWTVPAGTSAELVLRSFDACRSVVAAGNSGRFLLRPDVSATVQLRLSAGNAGTPPVVREYPVNTVTQGYQVNPAAARLASGGHVIAWQSAFDGPPSVCSRRYGLDGLAESAQTCLDDDGIVAGPAVAALAGGGHVLAWTVALPGSDDIHAQNFAASGAAAGAMRVVNTAAGQYISDVSVAGLAGGGHVVAWRSTDLGSAVVSILVRRFAADGSPLGDEAPVVSAGSLDADLPPYSPSALALPDGGYAITWTRRVVAAASFLSLYLQRFSAAGVPLGGPTLLMQDRGSGNVQVLGSGLLAAYGRDGLVRLQRLTLEGTLVGPEITPYPEETPPPGCVRYQPWPTPCTVIQDLPTMAAQDDGGYVVAWESLTVPYVGASLWAMRFAADGSPRGPATHLLDRMSQHALAARGDGGFVVAWRAANASDPADWADIFARQYSASGLLASP